MSQQYVRVLVAAGAVPWMIPLLGRHVHPARHLRPARRRLPPRRRRYASAAYHEEPSPLCGRTDPDRDEVELTLARWAMEDGKPLLAVCRGVQVINVAAGGTVHQDLAAQVPGSIKHDYFPGARAPTPATCWCTRSASRPTPGSGDCSGRSTIRVNSMHHQGIKRVAEGLRPNAFAPDGLVEGLESPNGHFLLGVQWHPEALADRDPVMRRLFAAFLEAAGS